MSWKHNYLCHFCCFFRSSFIIFVLIEFSVESPFISLFSQSDGLKWRVRKDFLLLLFLNPRKQTNKTKPMFESRCNQIRLVYATSNGLQTAKWITWIILVGRVRRWRMVREIGSREKKVWKRKKYFFAVTFVTTREFIAERTLGWNSIINQASFKWNMDRNGKNSRPSQKITLGKDYKDDKTGWTWKERWTKKTGQKNFTFDILIMNKDNKELFIVPRLTPQTVN